MTVATKIDFRVRREGKKLTETEVKLNQTAVDVLGMLGIKSVKQLQELNIADPRKLAKFLRLDKKAYEDFQNSLVKSEELMETSVRDELRKVDCAMGLLDADVFTHGIDEPAETMETLLLSGQSLATSTEFEGHFLSGDQHPIKYQGRRGTCVAFTMIRCREIAETQITESNKTKLSEQFAYWHMKELDGNRSEGTTLRIGGKMIVTLGTCQSESHPYQTDRYPESDVSQRGPKPPDHLLNEAMIHRAAKYREINPNDIEALKSLLQAGFPIAYGVPVFASWKTNAATIREGYVTLPLGTVDPVVGGHAIALTGFGIDPGEPGGGYFIFDNSWGETWGKDNQFGKGRGILPFKYALRYGKSAVVFDNE